MSVIKKKIIKFDDDIFDIEKFNQLNNKIKFSEDQSNLFFSNQHFHLLKQLYEQGEITSNLHIPLAFSYIYFITYMFRYAKYDYYVPLQYEIKEMLGYSKKDKKLNYLLKEDGILDKHNLTKTIYDFPLVQEFDKYSMDRLEFTMMTDLYDSEQWIKYKKVRKDTFCKYPVLAFFDTPDSFDEVVLFNEGGTFFTEYFYTNIPFEVFNYCICHKEIGIIGFYLYSYIKFKNGLLGEPYSATSQRLSNETKIGRGTVEKYLMELRNYNLVTTYQEMDYFIIGSKSAEEDNRLANSHYANDFNQFIHNETEIEMEYPKFIKKENYDELIKDQKKESKTENSLSDIQVNDIDDEIDRLLG